MSKTMKTILIGLGVFGAILAAVLVVYLVQKPTTETIVPSPTPTPVATPVTPEVSEVVPGQVCALTFTVTEEEIPETPVCDDTCDITAQDCESGLECLIPDGETVAVCRNPDYPEEADCQPPTSESPSPSPSDSPSPSPSDNAQSELSCVAKRAYENDDRNTAGSYYLSTEVTDANTLSNGEIVVYNIVATNQGDAQVTGVEIEDVLSSNLTYMDSSSGCSYSSSTRTVTCDLGTIPANTEASVSIRVQVATASTTAINNSATVSSPDGQEDICEISVSTTGEVVQPPSPAPSALPEAGVLELTTGTLGIGVLLLILGTAGLLLL